MASPVGDSPPFYGEPPLPFERTIPTLPRKFERYDGSEIDENSHLVKDKTIYDALPDPERLMRIQKRTEKWQVDPLLFPDKTEMILPDAILPPQLIGTWSVMGITNKIQTSKQYENAVREFAYPSVEQWIINGKNGIVGIYSTRGLPGPFSVEDNYRLATLRFTREVRSATATETIQFHWQPDGLKFTAIQEIQIDKAGEPEPRARLTRKLIGRRQTEHLEKERQNY